MKFIPLILLSFFLLTGCANEVIKDTIYLQNAKINAPVSQLPVFLTTSDSSSIFVVRPRIFIGNNNTYSSRVSGHSNVNFNGEFQVDTIMQDGRYSYIESPGANRYTFKGENYELNTTSLNIGFDADISISKSFIISGGLNFSNINQTTLRNWRGGIGLRNYSRPYGLRFDAGVSWQEVQYDVQSIIIREKTSSQYNEVFFLRDQGKQNNQGFYFNLNLTHDDPDALLGGFVNLGYIQQIILNVEPLEYDRSFYDNSINFDYTREYFQTNLVQEITTGFLNASSGIFYNFYENIRLIIGLKYITEISDNKIAKDQFSPFLQLHLAF
jgi:hypothetical protein